MKEFAGRAAVVTGAGSGLGRGLATKLAALGARVIVADIRKAKAEEVAAAIAAGGGAAHSCACDVSSRASVRHMKQAAEEKFGPVTLLFANAGVTSFEPMNGISDAEIDWIMQVNLMGVINCVQAFLPDMISAGGGHIVATSSPAGLIPALLSSHAPYAAAKAGIIGFIENLSLEVAPHGIRTTIVYPSYVDSDMRTQNSTYRPERFGGPFAQEIVPPADFVAKDWQDPGEAAEMVLSAMKHGRRMVITGDKFRDEFKRLYADEVMRAFDDAMAFRLQRACAKRDTAG